MTGQKHRYVFKVVVIGDGAVGKTSLINRFAEQKFIKEYKPTLGTNIVIKEIEDSDCSIRLLLWDIAGQDKWKDVRHLYYQGASAAILVFDVTRLETYNSIETWFDDLMKYAGDIPRVLIANKIDLVDIRRTNNEQIAAMARKVNAKYYETSAADGTNVLDAFTYLARLMIKKN